MRVKMKTVKAGPHPDDHAGIGQIVDVTHSHARELVDGGYAEAVDPFPEVDADTAGPKAGELPLGGEKEVAARKGRNRAGGAPETATASAGETATDGSPKTTT